MLCSLILTVLVSGLWLALQAQTSSAPGVVNLNPEGVLNLINAVIGWGQRIGIAVGALALLVAGYQWLMAWGSTRSLQSAREAFKFAVLGLVLILGCYVIPNLLQGAASAAPGA